MPSAKPKPRTKKAIALKPDYADAYYQLGAVYIRQKKYEAAYAPLRKALESDPRHISAYNALGLLHIRQGAYQEAAVLYERALQADSTHYELWYHLGQVHVKRGEREAAKTAFCPCARTDTTQAGAYAGLGCLVYGRAALRGGRESLAAGRCAAPVLGAPPLRLRPGLYALGRARKGPRGVRAICAPRRRRKDDQEFGSLRS